MKKQSKNDVVVVFMDSRYAVVRPSDWEEILRTNRLVNAILSCETWGEYRALGSNQFDDLIRDFAQIEDEPDDDEPLPADLPLNEGGEDSWWDRYAKLEIATTDFLESLEEADDLLAVFEITSLWSWVQPDEIRNVIPLLKDHGFNVIEESLD